MVVKFALGTMLNFRKYSPMLRVTTVAETGAEIVVAAGVAGVAINETVNAFGSAIFGKTNWQNYRR